MPQVYIVMIEIFLLFVLPISLIKFNIIKEKWRLFVLALVFLTTIFIVFRGTFNLHSLGIRKDNLAEAFPVYTIATFIAITLLIFFGKILQQKRAVQWYEDPHFLFLFIPISFAQQFIFQAFILFKLESIFPTFLAVIINALIFGYMHTIYPRAGLMFIFGTLAGLFFGTLYTFYPNLIVSSMAHSILNFTAVYLSFFTLLTEEGTPKKTELKFIKS